MKKLFLISSYFILHNNIFIAGYSFSRVKRLQQYDEMLSKNEKEKHIIETHLNEKKIEPCTHGNLSQGKTTENTQKKK